VNAGGARHLGQALDRALDLLAGHHHQVGHLVDDHHDVGQAMSRSMTSSSYVSLARLLVEAGLDGACDDLALGLGLRRRGR
jgi:hypothetical protein